MGFLEVIKVILLGLVEGITESLPLSGSGHDFLLREILKIGGSEGFSMALRQYVLLGNVLAVLFVYYHRLWPFGNRRLDGRTQKELKKMSPPRAALMRFVWGHCDGAKWKLWGKLLLASLPCILLSLLVGETLKERLFFMPVVGTFMLAGGLALLFADRLGGKNRQLKKMSQLDLWSMLILGCFQVLSLLPGISRVGVVICAALLLGASRTVAYESGLFLGILTSLVSALSTLFGGLSLTGMEGFFLILTMCLSFGVSVVAIRFLRRFLRSGGFLPFGVYQAGLGGILLIYQLVSKVILRT